MARIKQFFKHIGNRFRKLWNGGKKVVKTAAQYYDKGKEIYDARRGDIDRAKGFAEKYGGKYGQKASELATKGQSYIDKGIKKADEIRSKVKV